MKARPLAAAYTAGALIVSGEAIARHESGPPGQSRADVARRPSNSGKLLATEGPENAWGANDRAWPAGRHHDYGVRLEGCD